MKCGDHLQQKLDAAYNTIVAFIEGFQPARDFFMAGRCYWFAHILDTFVKDLSLSDPQFKEPFSRTDQYDDEYALYGEIVYEPVEGHFLFRVFFTDPLRRDADYFSLFDPSGDVTLEYSTRDLYPMNYLELHDPVWQKRLIADCRDFGLLPMRVPDAEEDSDEQ